MNFWIIRHKPTGGVMPELFKRNRRMTPSGYTGTKPKVGIKPRLFLSRASAKNSLNWWLRGSFSNVAATPSDEELAGWHLGASITVAPNKSKPGAMHVVKVAQFADRIAADMEIVEVELKEVKK